MNIILAAGKHKAQDKAVGLTQSDPLMLINGRPVISWIIREVLEKEPIVLVCHKDDSELVAFAKRRWGKYRNFSVVVSHHGATILHSLRSGLDEAFKQNNQLGSVRIILGDTIILNAGPLKDDTIYASNFEGDSSSWCVVSKKADDAKLCFYDKKENLSSPKHKALVGRYEFSNPALLKKCLTAGIDHKEKELSSILVRYDSMHSLNLSEVNKDNWIDCGHLEGIATAKQKLIVSRHFNSLEIDPILPIITKFSSDIKKLRQETYWYSNLPDALQSLTPRILEKSQSKIVMEYYGYGNLAEKFVYYDLPHNFWVYVLKRLFALVETFRAAYSSNKLTYAKHTRNINFENIYLGKILQRIDSLKSQNTFWRTLCDAEYLEINGCHYSNIKTLMPLLLQRAREIVQTATPSIIHGDLCFNNILFDIQSGVIKLIDPRGNFGTDKDSILGDSRYDIAKLRHSYCSDYDSLVESDFTLEKIDAATFVFKPHKGNKEAREILFDSMTERFGYDIKDIRFIEGVLFLTMVPLHSDSLDRQIAMWLTAIQKLNRELMANGKQ